jgi:tetratricopeptide (TPR) repeat protein
MVSSSKKYIQLGDEALEKGEHSKALDYFNRAVHVDQKNSKAWTRKAAAEVYLRQYSEAIESCDEALKLDRQSADAWFNRGLALDRRRKFDEALNNYDYALRYKPRHVKALNNKGTVLGQLERWDEARLCFEQVLKYDPKNEDAKENLKLLSDYKAGKHKSRCFIATAAYGSPLATELKYLRNWRDRSLLDSQFGRSFVRVYYKTSPIIAQIMSQYDFLKYMVRISIQPLISHLIKRYKI